MFTQSIVMNKIKPIIESSGINMDNPASAEKLSEAISASIYSILTSSEYLEFVDQMITKRINDNPRPHSW